MTLETWRLGLLNLIVLVAGLALAPDLRAALGTPPDPRLEAYRAQVDDLETLALRHASRARESCRVLRVLVESCEGELIISGCNQPPAPPPPITRRR